MNNILFKSIADYAAPCTWCIKNCSDNEKYEILVAGIKIRNEFSLIIRTINLMFGANATRIAGQIFCVFESQADLIHNYIKQEEPNLSECSKEEWKLPGCSQIFNITQLIEQTYSNKIRNSE